MLVFIHINKTAGRTVRYILRSSYGLRHCEVQPWHDPWKGPPFSSADLRRLRRIYPNLASIGGHRLRGHVDLSENGTKFEYFTVMRDPLKTCASRFQYNVQYRGKKDLVFEEWIQRDWTRNAQTKMIAGSEDVDEAIRIIHKKDIFVGLTERFDESMLMLKRLIANDLDIGYKRVNVARDNTLAKNLLANERTRQLLIDANQADQALYDYVVQELYPTFCQEYGPNLEEDASRYQQTWDMRFNDRNLALSRLKQYLLYQPVLFLYRKGSRSV